MQWQSFEKWVESLKTPGYDAGFASLYDEELGKKMVKGKKRTSIVKVFFEGPGESEYGYEVSNETYTAHLLVIKLENAVFVMIDPVLRFTGGTETSSEDQLWDGLVESAVESSKSAKK